MLGYNRVRLMNAGEVKFDDFWNSKGDLIPLKTLAPGQPILTRGGFVLRPAVKPITIKPVKALEMMKPKHQEFFVNSVTGFDEKANAVLNKSLNHIYGDKYPMFVEDKIHWFELTKDIELSGEYILQDGCAAIRINARLLPEEMVDTTTHEFIHALVIDRYETNKTFRDALNREFADYKKPLGGRNIFDLDVAPLNYISDDAYDSPEEYITEAGVAYYNHGRRGLLSPRTVQLLKLLTKSPK